MTRSSETTNKQLCVCRRPAERNMRLRLRRRTSLTTHRTSTEQLSIKQTPEHTCTQSENCFWVHFLKLMTVYFSLALVKKEWDKLAKYSKFFLVHFEALFNCIMTIMNMSFNSSLIGECCSCEARDNHCTSTAFGFYFNWSLLAFPPTVFHLTAPMKENWPFLFFKLLMF